MLLRSMQNHEELADAKAENDALRDDVAAGRRQLHIKAVCQSVRERRIWAWIMQPPRLADTAERVISPLREEADRNKTTGRNQKYSNRQCR